MNTYHKHLWMNLNALVMHNDAFFSKDFVRDDKTYRIFNYRLASYTDFCEPDALECRGIMFEIIDNVPVRLAALPPEKFFNYQENPFTMEMDLTLPAVIMDKADGSLISSYMHGDVVCMKSKGSIDSTQSADAERVLRSNDELHSMVLFMTQSLGLTVNFEYVAPHNRIVLAYDKEQLIILNVRDMETGAYVSKETLMTIVGLENIDLYWVDEYDLYNDFGCDDFAQFVEEIRHMTGREGFVVMLGDQHVKFKTEWYLTQHRAKDSINSPRRLFEAVLEEATDDLRSLFHDQPAIIQTIADMELRVEEIYNPLVNSVEQFHKHNKNLERKDYAILGQKTFTKKGVFGLVMSKYLGKEVDYKMFLRKHYKDYGIADDPIPTGDE